MGWYVIVGSLPIVILGVLAQGRHRARLPQPVDHRRRPDRVGLVLASPTDVVTASEASSEVGLTRRGAARARAGGCPGARASPGPGRPSRWACSSAWTARRRPGSHSCWRSRPSSGPGSTSSRRSRTATTTTAGARRSSRPWSSFVVGYAAIAWLLRYVVDALVHAVRALPRGARPLGARPALGRRAQPPGLRQPAGAQSQPERLLMMHTASELSAISPSAIG